MHSWCHDLLRPQPRYTRAMGYVRGLRRLSARGRRCRRAWAPHIEQCRTVILEAAGLCKRHDRALIVGSGPLFDVPVTQLSWRFKEVVLADIVHLRRIRQRMRRYGNVHLETVDVTGMAEAVYSWARTGEKKSRPPDRAPDAFSGEKFDLVVSCNILSQLPLGMIRYAQYVRGRHSIRDEADFSRRMVTRHLDWLASFSGNACLIADTDQFHIYSGRITCRNGILWGITLPEGGRQWHWDLAPRPEISEAYDVQHRVVGYAQFPKESWLHRDGAGLRIESD